MAGTAVIYGSTVAGCFAAKAAIEKGATSVTVISPDAFRSGMAGGGIVLVDVGSARNEWGYWKTLSLQIAEHYGGPGADISYSFRYEPKAFFQYFNPMVDVPGIAYVYNAPLESVEKSEDGKTIVSITCGGTEYAADAFADCSYEGDLIAMAGVSCTYGRESQHIYGESLAGVAFADREIRTYRVVDDKGNRYDNAQANWSLPDGVGDPKVQGYNFRQIWSVNSDRVPWAAPPGYRREDFLDVLDEIQRTGRTSIFGGDWWFQREINGDLSGGSSTNKPRPQAAGKYGINQRDQYWISGPWITGTHAERQKLMARLYYRFAGTLYFCANDSALAGTAIQASANAIGLCPDEYQDNGLWYGQPGWPNQVYVREGRRMIGQYLMTEDDHGRRGHVPDGICCSQYFIDRHTIQHNANPDGTTSYKEGHRGGGAYKFTTIPMRAMKPWPGQADNLIVPVPSSATSVLWQPHRMEPTFSMMGQVAGWVIAKAVTQGKTTNAVTYAEIQPYLAAESAIIA